MDQFLLPFMEIYLKNHKEMPFYTTKMTTRILKNNKCLQGYSEFRKLEPSYIAGENIE